MKKNILYLKDNVKKIPLYFKYYIKNYNNAYFLKLLKTIKLELTKIGYKDINGYKIRLTTSNVLLIILNFSSSTNKLVCKIPLDNISLKRLKNNYNSLKLIDRENNYLTPKPILKIYVDNDAIFIEEFIDGLSGYDIYINTKRDIHNILRKAEEALYNIRENIFNNISNNLTISSDSIFENFITSINISAIEIPQFLNTTRNIKYLFNNENIKVGLTHGDFWLGNIIYSKDLDVIGIIDWDRLSFKTPLVFDKLHLKLYYNAISQNTSIGYQIIKSIKCNQYNIKDILLYWIIFLNHSMNSNPNLFKDKKWVSENIKNVINFINQKL